MASFYAELEVTGHTYPIRICQFSFTQATDERGRVRGKVRHGLVHLSLDTPQDDFLLMWGITAHKLLAGHITFFETNQRTARETMSFVAGECVGYHETFDAGDNGAGAYISHLTIVAPKLVLSAGGASKPYVAAKARGYKYTPILAPFTANLRKKLAILGPDTDANARSMMAQWIANGLDADKLNLAIAKSINKSRLFQRLRNAKKGIYEQRVIIDDYESIPGVDKEAYVQNGLPAVSILASSFGVADPAFDLPKNNAPTFTGNPKLVELKPGEKIYRVTNGPQSKAGGYWTRTPPTSLASVIGGTAVMPEWNSFQNVYEFTVPPYTDANEQEPKFYVWEGPTAAQPVSQQYPDKIENGYCLKGGGSQLFIPEKLSRSPEFAVHIQDVTHLHKSW